MGRRALAAQRRHACDRFVTATRRHGSDEFAIGYYLEEDLRLHPAAAEAFTLYDRFFCSLMASTYPNRHYMWAAQAGGQQDNALRRPATRPGFQWETIFDRALARASTAALLQLRPALRGAVRAARRRLDRADRGLLRATRRPGRCRSICFVDPPFRDGGGGNGVSADEHPHGDIRLGQAFMSDVVHAFMESPQYKRGALFIIYDEWGGFFDHVRAAARARPAQNRDLDEDWGLMGFRIPACGLARSRGAGTCSHATLGFESILKLISYRFGLGHLNRRHRYAYNIGRTLEWDKPSFTPPELPDPAAIMAKPCRLGGSGAAARPKDHDIVWLETTGYLDRLGYQVRAGHAGADLPLPGQHQQLAGSARAPRRCRRPGGPPARRRGSRARSRRSARPSARG